jgi:hypothetical protein
VAGVGVRAAWRGGARIHLWDTTRAEEPSTTEEDGSEIRKKCRSIIQIREMAAILGRRSRRRRRCSRRRLLPASEGLPPLVAGSYLHPFSIWLCVTTVLL